MLKHKQINLSSSFREKDRVNNLMFRNRPRLFKSLDQAQETFKKLSNNNIVLPTNFDWRNETGTNGESLLTNVRDQGNCGSCYAFCISGMLADRASIATMGNFTKHLSPQDMVNCGREYVRNNLNPPTERTQKLIDDGIFLDSTWFALEGCNGGLMAAGINYIIDIGLPLEIEQPYKEKEVSCKNTNSNECRVKGNHAEDLCVGIETGFPDGPIFMNPTINQQNVNSMMLSIYLNGPIVTGLNIYSDFYYYPQLGEIYDKQDLITVDGVTQPVNYMGSHAVEIVGWGETNGTKYWICKNSWGTNFGLDGYFKILRGVNEVNIEYDSIAATVDINSLTFPNMQTCLTGSGNQNDEKNEINNPQNNNDNNNSFNPTSSSSSSENEINNNNNNSGTTSVNNNSGSVILLSFIIVLSVIAAIILILLIVFILKGK
jgi:hypothetical protein